MTVAIFALLTGLAGAYTVRQYLQQPKAEAAAAARVRNTTIAMASTDLVAGKTLVLGDIVVMSLSPEQVKRRNVPADAMTNTQFIVGRVLKNALKKGDSFLTTDLYPDGMGPSVVERLKPGLRAVTVPVTDLAAVSGFATPGSMVDVLFRVEARGTIPETLVTLVENVEVLANGQSTVPGVRGKIGAQLGMVTLAVTPKQASSLQVAIGHGDMTLAMRNPDDVAADAGQSRMTLDQLLGMQYFGPKRMEIIRGGSRETLLFQDNQFLGSDQVNGGAPAAAPVTTNPPNANPPVGDIRVTGLQPAGN
jgi:pilus assembly protein CpaB